MSQPETNVETQRVSPWGALVKVLYDPAGTFEGFGEKAPLLPSYLVAMIFGVGTVLLTIPASLQIQSQMTTQALPPQAMAFARTFTYITGTIGGAASPWIAGLFMALICMFFGQFVGGERVSFGRYFAMVGYARLPQVLSGLIGGFLSARAETMQDLQNISLSLAVFAPEGSSSLVKALLGLVNPFMIWSWILLAVGFGTLHRVKPSKAMAMIITLAVGAFIMGLLGTMAIPGMNLGK